MSGKELIITAAKTKLLSVHSDIYHFIESSLTIVWINKYI